MIPRLKQWLKGGAAPVLAADAQRILMVCTGNICRSPTAEGVLRAKLQRAGLQRQALVDSAGTHGYHTAEAPDARAVQSAARRGYDISGCRARPLNPEDFANYDWLFAMDQTHLEWMLKRAPPESAGRIGLLMPFARRHPGAQEVPDPYYGGPAGFEHVLDLLEDACDGLVEKLFARPPHGSPPEQSASQNPD